MNNLKKFQTEADYTAATLNYPAVSWVTGTDVVHFDKTASTFSGLTVYYNITDILQPTELFKGGGGSGSGSGSGSGGVLPSAMIIDGTAVEVTNTYQFSTTGEHIVNFSFADNQIPEEFLFNIDSTKDIVIGDAITSIGDYAFYYNHSLTSCTIGSGVTSIGAVVFEECHSLTSIVIPSGVTSIGVSVFARCSSLTSITSLATTAPSILNQTFLNVNTGGTLTVPSGSSGYDTWMQNVEYYLGLYGWTKVEQ